MPLHAPLASEGCEKKRRRDDIHPVPAWGAFFPPPACGDTLGLESSTLSPEELAMLTATNLEKGMRTILLRKTVLIMLCHDFIYIRTYVHVHVIRRTHAHK